MSCSCRALLAVIALSAPAIGRAEEPTSPSKAEAWPRLEWKKAAPSPFARVESPTAVVDGKMYLFGGFTDDLGASNELDVYDPANDSWTRKKDMPTRLTHLNPAVDGKTVWFAGGFQGKHPGPASAEVWKYDVAADSWAAGPDLPERRASGGLAVVGGKLHYFGGYKADRDTNAADHWSLSLDGGKEWRARSGFARPAWPCERGGAGRQDLRAGRRPRARRHAD